MEEEGEWGDVCREEAEALCRHDDDPGDPAPAAVSEDTDFQKRSQIVDFNAQGHTPDHTHSHTLQRETMPTPMKRPHPRPHPLTERGSDGEGFVEVSSARDWTESVVLFDPLHLLLHTWF